MRQPPVAMLRVRQMCGCHGRRPIAVDLDILGDVLGDQRGGCLDLSMATACPIEPLVLIDARRDVTQVAAVVPIGALARYDPIATNLPFSEWGSVFPDPRLVAAIVDRVTFNAHTLETGTQSYRLRTSMTTTRRQRSA